MCPDLTGLHASPNLSCTQLFSSPQNKTNSPLSRLPNKPNIGPTYTPPLWLTRMFRPIKHENLTRNRLGGNQIGILWHIPSTVHLPIMIYPLDDLNPGCRGRRRKRVAP